MPRILARDYCRSIYDDVFIGKRCLIGADTLILPGVIHGDNTIVAAGTLVTKLPECGVILAGNPAKIVRTRVVTRKYG